MRGVYAGIRGTPIYTTWQAMKHRCYHKSHKNYDCYGGRGISVCDEWKNDVSAFADWAHKNGFRHGLTIDRINNDGNYEPSNCRFITIQEQQWNKRPRTSKKLIKVGGISRSQKEWAKERGISDAVISERRKLGWSDEQAINTPINARRNGAEIETLQINGVVKTIPEWERSLGFGRNTLRRRLNLGWDIQKAISEPVRHIERRNLCAQPR